MRSGDGALSNNLTLVWRRRAAWSAGLCLLFLAVVQNPAHRGGNTASRLATVESLVDRGTWDISDSPFLEETHDYVVLDGRALSSKPPLLPAAAAGVYFAIHQLTGLSLVRDIGIVHRLLILFTEIPAQALLLLFGWRLLGLFTDDPRARGWTFLVLCFGFLGAGYATTLNNHSPAAAAAVVGLYFATRAFRAEVPEARDLALAGLALGLLPTLDLPSALISACIGLPLAVRHPKRVALFLVGPALVPVAASLLLTYSATGGLSPIYARGDLYHYEGSYWDAPQGMDALHEPKWIYVLNLLVGHHGFFLMTPVFVYALGEAWHQLRARGPGRHLAWAALVSFAGILFAYVMRSGNYGGACVGVRWLIPVMPLFVLLLAPKLARDSTQDSWLFRFAFFVSVVSFVNAAVHPWSHSGIHFLFHQFVDTGALL